MAEDDKGADILSTMRKMGRVERWLRRWWMQRQLWKAYKKAITIMWAEYEAARKAQNKELYDKLFLRMMEFRRWFEEGRAVIDAVFETIPKLVIPDE